MRSWTLVVMLGVLWPARPVMAEHTADHRYTIVGYVKQADGTPRPNTLVSVRGLVSVSRLQRLAVGIAYACISTIATSVVSSPWRPTMSHGRFGSPLIQVMVRPRDCSVSILSVHRL